MKEAEPRKYVWDVNASLGDTTFEDASGGGGGAPVEEEEEGEERGEEKRVRDGQKRKRSISKLVVGKK